MNWTVFGNCLIIMSTFLAGFSTGIMYANNIITRKNENVNIEDEDGFSNF
jgi:hypothetical protein